ncbi:hypothetical protein EDB81DRAFT_860673 [Dactylonectria macrodidyma]|uniref:Amidohydrolase-related domain-containing protein n=1 Tax=Dactylonectria macrodidyma TaxID=307937 RepID=A0A9P9DW04_9HYPO|nr:hypothetical protein EDB81DRAFT_860673 [Dactylonectria macrodidyma]
MATKGGILSLEPPPYSDAPRPIRRPIRRRRRLVATLLLTLLVGFTALIYLNTVINLFASRASTAQANAFHEGLSKCHETRTRNQQEKGIPSRDRVNPRWNAITGQQTLLVIKNATVFDGERTLEGAFDITFESGIIRSVSPTAENKAVVDGAQVINVNRKFVTPGLVDMHSHHLTLPFPGLSAITDISERPLMGPITPFVRALDGFKPYDPAIKIIASGGVTSSLILPGSANIVGGEAYLVKNLPLSGENREPVVDELLLDHGLPETDRRRYLKMACGENPKNTYHNSRLGLAWLLREHLDQAQQLRERQDAWCQAAFGIDGASLTKTHRVASFIEAQGKRPDDFKLQTSLALLRGELNINVHCYEPEDFESMLSVLHEFGVHPQAFHHALEAWEVPELLKRLEENITIATFAENALFKAEAYGANLRGPKILNDHGIPVAFKSDHTGEGNFAKYLVYQAAIAHSFGLPENKSLQSVTSIPARSIQQHHRIGYARPGYDADLVIWDDHPLQVGATPSQIFIDGRPVLDVAAGDLGVSAGRLNPVAAQKVPAIRPTVAEEARGQICTRAQRPGSKVAFIGIEKVLINSASVLTENVEDYVLVVEDGRIACLDKKATCLSDETLEYVQQVTLKHGHITPGLVAFGNKLGIQSIPSETSTGDGSAGKAGDALNEQKRLHYAKYGVHLHGKAFTRARIGGVTKAVTVPLFGGGIIQGVSVGLRVGENGTILDNIWKDDVALHLAIGQSAKGDDTPTVSSGVERLRQLLQAGHEAKSESHSIYSQAANGSLPLVVEVYNEDDISQLILVKRDFPSANLVIYGGHGAPLVAKHLADAAIPVILTGNRGGPTSWEKKNALTGPPQTESPAKILLDSGVLLGLAVTSDSKVHGLAQEGRWAGKYAGLSDKQAVALVSTNIETILGIFSDREKGRGGYHGDFVVWEGDPLRGEGSVVVTVQSDGKISDCWPDTENAVL